jgi:hypothetical protein
MKNITAQEIYNETIQSLPPTEQLRLANLILNELQKNLPEIDQKDYWTEEDQADITNFSMQYTASFFPDEEND